MSPLIFATKSGSGYDVELAGVGVIARDGKGGVLVEEAAATVHELQDGGEPLAGKKLEDAARAFAKSRDLTVRSVKGDDLDVIRERLRVEAGAFPAGKSIEEISREAVERDNGSAEARAAAGSPGDPAELPPQSAGPDNETAR